MDLGVLLCSQPQFSICGGFDRGTKSWRKMEKNPSQTQRQNKSAIKSDTLISTICLHWSLFGDPGSWDSAFPACSSHQVLFAGVSVLQKYRTGAFSDTATSSPLLSAHAQVLPPFFLASSHPFKF